MYSIIRKASRTPRQPVAFHISLLVPGFWAIDVETSGLDPLTDHIVGIGLANATHCFYIDIATLPPSIFRGLPGFLDRCTLTAFNVMFDGTFLQQFTGKWLNFVSCSYGMFKQLSGEGFTGQSWNLETAQREVLGWTTSNKTDLEQALTHYKLTKATMSQLPAAVLGPYCASDADAAYQLHVELLQQSSVPSVDYHTRIFLPQIQLLAEQQLRGIHIDQAALKTCHATLLGDIATSLNSFLSHPEVTHHIAAHNQVVKNAWTASEPPSTTKAGIPSARHMAWQCHKLATFNSNSKKQLADLFYNKMGYKATKNTPTGRPVIDRKVLPSLGGPGKLLNTYNLQVKRRGYVESLIGKTERNGQLHPSFNSVGTVTGRLGGSGGLNLQQMPKVADFLACFSARPEHVLVQLDLEAIEPTILAEFSQDKTMLQVYGAGAKPNDIYLLIASKIPALCKEVRKYYDPENPTAEGIADAKKFCKKERSIAKVCKLAYDYGAGATKMHETLQQSGVVISLSEVRDIRYAMDRMFPGIKRFEDSLKDIWEANSGWIPSILGTPICVDHTAIKDIVNRFCQTSGHQVLQLLIASISKLRNTQEVIMYPWLLDLHDETIWEVMDGAEPTLALQVMNEALRLTNEELGMGIPVKGTPMIARTLADIKCT